MEERMHNPWLGLRAYQEGQTIYGRTQEILSLSQCVINNIQTVVYGRSGIGKSSILNAGVFPVARRAGLFPVSIRLEHNAEPYIKQISSHIRSEIDHLRKDVYNEQGEKVTVFEAGSIKELVPAVNPETETLWEFFHRHEFFNAEGEKIKPLVVFDQFEEIFTLERNPRKIQEFFGELANLLNGIMPDYIAKATDDYSSAPIIKELTEDGDEFNFVDFDIPEEKYEAYLPGSEFHIVLTLREDFLSYLERNSVSIPILKQNRYCLQAIDEEQAAIIIMKPIPGIANKEVAKRIIAKVVGDDDFELDEKPERQVDSAILSLYLSRLYDKMVEDGEEQISLTLVDRYGDNIIQSFYEDTIKGISAGTVEYLENNLLNYDGRRENVSLTNALNIGKVPKEEIEKLKEERLIRVFSYGEDLRIEFIHDILCPVINERREKRKLEREQEAERQALLAEEKRKRHALEEQARKNRRIIISLVSFVALASAIGLGCWVGLIKDYSVYYPAFTTLDGWPEGVGEAVPFGQLNHYPVYYKLTRPGRLSYKQFDRVEVVNMSGKLVDNHFVESQAVSLSEIEGNDLTAAEFAGLQHQVCRWEYQQESDGKGVSRVLSLDRKGELLYAVQFYTLSKSDSTKLQWAVFLDKSGRPLTVRNNGLDRMKVSSMHGRTTGVSFYSSLGIPQDNYEGVYGYRYGNIDDKTGLPGYRYSLNEFGDSVDSPSILEWENGICVRDGGASIHYSRDAVYTEYVDGQKDTLLFTPDGTRQYLSTSAMLAKLLNRDRVRCLYNAEGHMSELRCYTNDEMDSLYRIIPDGADTVILSWSPSRKYPYQCDRFSHEGNSTFLCHYGGMEENAVSVPIMEGGYFKREQSVSILDDGSKKEIYRYFDTEGNLFGDGGYAVLEFEYDSNDRLRKRIEYGEDNQRLAALCYEYDSYGALSSRYVPGIDGKTPVRCGSLDEDQVSYYRMKFVESFTGENVAVKGENEFGEECLMTHLSEPRLFIRQIVPNVPQEYRGQSEAKGVSLKAIPYVKIIIETISNPISVCYVHLLSKEGSAYKSGLKDGDLLIEMGSWKYRIGDQPLPLWQWGKDDEISILVARPNPEEDKYDVLSLNLSKGDRGAEIYKVFLTEAETARLKQSLNI